MQACIGISYGSRKTIPLPSELRSKTIEDLISCGFCEEKELTCEDHNLSFVAKPIAKSILGIIYSECPECEKDREKRRQAEDQKERDAIIKRKMEIEESVLRSRGCGSKYLNMRRSIKVDTDLFNTGILKYLETDGGDFKHKDKLVILGGCGIGKTFFANMLVEKAYKIGKKYICLNAFEVSSIYRSKNINGFNRTNSFENLIEALDGVDCLIIDEIDYFMSKTNDVRDEEALHHIAQICEKEDIRTIILGNCNKEELKEMMPPKVYSRFSGGKVINGWNMKDLRSEK